MAREGSVKVVFHIKGPGGFTQPRMRGYRRLYRGAHFAGTDARLPG